VAGGLTLARSSVYSRCAFAVARRANALLTRLQGSKRSVGSVLYDGGRHEAHVYENTAPAHFPESRPHYE